MLVIHFLGSNSVFASLILDFFNIDKKLRLFRKFQSFKI